jgi:hypothetical protein
MGYGEVGGGGSIHWDIVHDDPNDLTKPPKNLPAGKKRQAWGRDMDPDTKNGDKMYVVIEGAKVLQVAAGQVIVEVTIQNKGDQVQIKWGKDVTEELRQLSASVPPPAAR